MKKLKTVFMGTPAFSVPCLEQLFNNDSIDLHSIVTMPNRKAGRGHKVSIPPVAEFAINNKIKLIQSSNINNEHEYLETLIKDKVDLIIVIAFAQFLSNKVLMIPQTGCFNIHTSLLPKYRGAAPIQYAILNDDKETGVSIQKMVKKMDAGDIALLEKIDIFPEETSGELFSRLQLLAAGTLEKFILKLSQDSLELQKQNEQEVSFAPEIKREDGHIKFSKCNYNEIKNKLRAFDPWPGIYTILNNKRLKILKISSSDLESKPGEIIRAKDGLYIGSKDKTIKLEQVQLEGKKASSGKDLLNGLREELFLGE